MVIVTSGKDREGKPLEFYMDGTLKKVLDKAKQRVKKRNWDYVCLVCGLPGSGKSTFARRIARYCCEWFTEKYIAFTDEEFIEITNKVPEFSSVILDESFMSLNTRVTMSPEFVRIVNHLQIIRQKHLFIILCLPNFFDLSKGVAVFRSNHLFMTYASEEGRRGKFLAWGRSEKRKLYVKGGKYMDYNTQASNFKGKYTRVPEVVPVKLYEKMKFEHLQAQQKQIKPFKKRKEERDDIIYKLRQKGWKVEEISEVTGLKGRTLYDIFKKFDE